MAYKCSFMDNQVYTAQDVSDIFARITSGGVVFTDTGYVFGDLNETQNQAVTGGVTRDTDSCKVINEDGIYKISKGACFMDDGTAIIFDEDGYHIDIAEGTENYVYLFRNDVANSIDVVVSTYAGGDGCIPLAEIDRNGHIYDRRRYATSKVDIGTQGSIRNFTVNFTECSQSGSETVTVDMGDGAFSHIIMWDGKRDFKGEAQPRVATNRNLVELSEGEDISLTIGRYQGDQNEFLKCKKDGQKMHLYLSSAFPYAEYTLNLGVI